MILKPLKALIGQRSPVRLLWHRGKALVAASFYGFPARKLTIIGVTGTDGKTTTVGMIAHILSESGIRTGALSTAFFKIGDSITWNATQKTSPSPFVIQKFLCQLVCKGCTHAVLEYSSHGLVQGRTLYTWPKVAGITNTSEEHLDYHRTMEQYRKDKGILFEMLGGKGTKVLNRDDKTFELYNNIPSKEAITYSSKEGASADLTLGKSESKPASVSATLHVSGKEYPLTLPIPGYFNLENALCAVGCAKALGIKMDDIVAALRTFHGIPGRMERIGEGQPFSLYIDFTVTPASYEKTLSTIKNTLEPGKKLLVLAGSCGDRMKEKRPLVGKICSQYADVLVIANEDPYTEDPEKIIDEVFAGIDQSKTDAHRIFDRRKAIEFLFSQAKSGDAVILCGKGSDTTMWTKDGQIPWNERAIARDILSKHD